MNPKSNSGCLGVLLGLGSRGLLALGSVLVLTVLFAPRIKAGYHVLETAEDKMKLGGVGLSMVIVGLLWITFAKKRKSSP